MVGLLPIYLVCYDDIKEEACVGNNYDIRSKGAPKINDFLSTSNTIAISIEISS